MRKPGVGEIVGAVGLCGVLVAGEMAYRYGLLTGRPHARTDVDDVVGSVFDRVERLEAWETGPFNGYGLIDELTGAVDPYFGTVCSPRGGAAGKDSGSDKRVHTAAIECRTRDGIGAVLEEGTWTEDTVEPAHVSWNIRGGVRQSARSATIEVTDNSFHVEASATGFGDKGAETNCNSDGDGSDFNCDVHQGGANWRVKLSHSAGMRLVKWLRSEVVSRLRNMREMLDLSSSQ